MAKSSKTSGKKGTTAGKAPTVTKKPKATAGVETVAPLAAGTTSTSAAAVAAATTAKATRSSATKQPGSRQPGSSQMAPAVITSEERHRLIAEAAYLLAEKRGFQGGSPEQDWYEAAAQIDETIMGTNRGSGT